MGSFDEYRRRWVYRCPQCNAEVTAFRDCGEISPCVCGGNMKLVNIIEPKHIEYDGESQVAIHTFKPYFDVTLGKEITSEREIKEYCVKNNCIYAGDKEISQQCAQNKRKNVERQNREFRQNLTEQLMRTL